MNDNTMIVKLSIEQAKFLETQASILSIPRTSNVMDQWYYMPGWYHKIGENLFEVVSFQDLPNHVIQFVKASRESTELL